MKTYLIPLVLAAFAALFASPVSAESATALIFTVGLSCIVIYDYAKGGGSFEQRMAKLLELKSPRKLASSELRLAA